MKKLLIAVAMGTVFGVANADDAPQWIGLDTTIRDQQTWVQPTEENTAGSLDTVTFDFWKSAGETIKGAFYGFIMLFK